MDSTQANSQKCLQQAIDTEIKSLEEYIRALKLRRNALSPISSLPPEVFALIFSFACLPGIPSPGKKPDHHPVRPYVSHVCCQWREIALKQPFLWNHVDFNKLSWAGATEMLVRAKLVPLYLKSRVPSHRWRYNEYCRLGKEVQARILRICQLSVCAKPTLLECTLKGLVSPAPTLESLSLSSRGESQKLDIPNTLFNGHTPKLSCLELRNCDINWKSPLLKGLEYLEIIKPFRNARPSLVVWLDVLNEMPQLKKLTLHSASPISPLPFDVERAITLPSLTHLDISAPVGDCALALAHLDLPVLTCLCVTVHLYHPQSSNVQGVLPYVVRHAHGPQDIRPLQSLLFRSRTSHLDILAWPVPDIDIEVHDPPVLLGVALPTRVALSFQSMNYWLGHDTELEVLDAVMTALPLDSLVMLTVPDRDRSHHQDLSTPQFWLRYSPKWPLLRRVRLAGYVGIGFVHMLEVDGGREIPLLPSLTELVLVEGKLAAYWTRLLCDALMKRVEQGVPLQMLDLRAYSHRYDPAELRLLSEIVVDVLGPVYNLDPDEELDAMGKATRREMRLWEDLACGPFPFLRDDHPDDEDEKGEEGRE